MEPKKKTIKEKWKAFAERAFRFETAPHRQWGRLLSAMLALIVLLAALHAYLYYGIQDGRIFGAQTVAPVSTPALDGGKLSAVLDRFNAKAAVRANSGTAVPAVIDPSK